MTPDEFLDAFQEKKTSFNSTIGNGIPKILHQTWKTREILPMHESYAQSWKLCLDESWIRVLWTHEDMESVVEKEAPYMLNIWKNFGKWIERVDSFRYVLLKRYGGVYVDLDIECLRAPILPKDGDCGVVLSESPYHRVQNSVMASKPNNVFWDEVIKLVMTRADERKQRKTTFAENLIPFLQKKVPVHNSTGVSLLYSAYADSKSYICKLPCKNWEGRCDACTSSLSKCNPNNATLDKISETLPMFTVHHGTQSWMRDARLADHRLLLIW
eukprot:CAMPEP_0167745778 /NCGR_PEP_ID=MMETSP0110_2-20121227/3342_1 /TAXON_ID=629695 /ORGANISM="Gymnochlora sp., Strain CCMP2014" /LENGTH=270 /DNA_ID=CAMNT_0007630461 /DNA_START=56 /DNA_END=865 /DNA_ORIENTATION=+